MTDIDRLAQTLFGGRRAESQEVSTDATTRTYIGVATSDSEDGTAYVSLDGDVTLPDDIYDPDGNAVVEYEDEGIEMAVGPSIHEGDEVIVTLVGGGPLKTPMVTAVSGEGDRQDAAIDDAARAAETAWNWADEAHTAATEAQERADEAAQSAENAAQSASTAATAATNAQQSASTAATAATSAQGDASTAAQAATAAQGSASTAATAAQSAEASASAAAEDASVAATQASAAQASAARANTAANSALTQLSVVEDVAGTLQWISDHGTFVPTTDTSVVEGRVYFAHEGGDYVPIAKPTGNPAAQGWYVLDVSESQTDYIMAHLTVTSAGLWVLPSGIGQAAGPQTAPGYKLLLASDGARLYDASGQQVMDYGESIAMSSSRPQYIGGENAFIIYYDSDNDGVPDTIRIGGNVLMGGDKTLSEVLAELGQVTEDVANLSVGGTNLIIHDTILSGQLQDDGTIHSSGIGAYHKHTEPIPVEGGAPYVLSWFYKVTEYATAYCYVSWFDSDSDHILREPVANLYNQEPSCRKYVAPDAAAYAIVTMSNYLVTRCAVRFERGTVPTDLSLSVRDATDQPNVLRGTNQPDVMMPYMTEGEGYWRRGNWRVQSGKENSGDAEIIEVDDCPDARQRYGFRVWSTTTGNKDAAQCLIPYEADKYYRVGGFVRLTPEHEQTSATLQFRIYGGSAFKTYTVSVTSEEWVRFAYIFSLTDTQVEIQPFTLFGVKGKGSLDYCGLYMHKGYIDSRLSLGEEYLPWQPAAEDYDAQYSFTSSAIAETSANAVKRTQRIYYRTQSTTAPTAEFMPTAWVTETGDRWAAGAAVLSNWTTKVTPISDGTDKYLCLFTCEQREMGDGTLLYTNVLLDDSTTVIDGGSIITGSVAANRIDAASGTFSTANIPALTADHIKANVIDAVNNGTGTINADKINVNAISIGDLDGADDYATKQDAQGYVDAVKVGGRNLLWKTENIFSSWYDNACSVTEGQIDPFGGNNAVLITPTTSTHYYIYRWARLNMPKHPANGYGGIDFTFSIWLKAADSNATVGLSMRSNNSAKHMKTVELTDSWSCYELTGSITDNITNNDVVWVGQEGTDPYYVAYPKLECGTKSTDWTPAPEDVDSSISGVQANLDAESAARKATYGTCSTDAGTAAKVVTCDGFEPHEGARLTVRFTSANTAASPTLTVQDGDGVTLLGAKDVWRDGAAGNPVTWDAGAVLSFVYDGTRWNLDDNGTRTMAEDAAKTATNYVTAINGDGIWVTPSDAKPVSGQAASTTTGWHISDVLEMFRAGVSMFKVWVDETTSAVLTRIGQSNGRHLLLDDAGISLKNATSTLARFAASGIEFLEGVATLSMSEETEEYDEGEGTVTDYFHRTILSIRNTASASLPSRSGIRAIKERFESGTTGAIEDQGSTAEIYANDGTVIETLVSADTDGIVTLQGHYLRVNDTTDPQYDPDGVPHYVGSTVTMEDLKLLLEGGMTLFTGEYSTTRNTAITLHKYNDTSAQTVSAENFSMLRIICEDSDGQQVSTDIYDPDGKKFSVTTTTATQGTLYVKSKSFYINGANIGCVSSNNVYRHGESAISASGVTYDQSKELIGVVRVIGFY